MSGHYVLVLLMLSGLDVLVTVIQLCTCTFTYTVTTVYINSSPTRMPRNQPHGYIESCDDDRT